MEVEQRRKRKRNNHGGNEGGAPTGGGGRIPIPSFSTIVQPTMTPSQSNRTHEKDAMTISANKETKKVAFGTASSRVVAQQQQRRHGQTRKRKSEESDSSETKPTSTSMVGARRKLSLPTTPSPGMASSSSLAAKPSSSSPEDISATPLSTLLRVEAALDLSLRSNRYNRRKGGGGGRLLVTLSQFYQIVSKLSLVPTNTASHGTASEDKSRTTLNEAVTTTPAKKGKCPTMELSFQERVLFDLIRIASPELYRIVTIEDENEDPLLPPQNKSRVQLEMVLHNSLTSSKTKVVSRIDQLKQLYRVRSPAVRHFVEARILASIMEAKKPLAPPPSSSPPVRNSATLNDAKADQATGKTPDSPSLLSKTHAFQTPLPTNPPPLQAEGNEENEACTGVTPIHTNIKSTSLLLEPYIRPGMTLQQRVEARAKYKQQREEQYSVKKSLQLQSTNTMSLGSEEVLIKTDKVTLLRFADSLRSMMRLVGSRSFALSSVTSSKSSITRRGNVTQKEKQPLSEKKEGSERRKGTKATSMSIQDICVHINGAGMMSSAMPSNRGGAANPTPIVRMKQKRATSKEIMAILNDLALVVPEWIRVEHRGMSKDANQQPKKQRKKESFVVIRNDVDYSMVRVKLGGRSSVSFPKKKTVSNDEEKGLVASKGNNSRTVVKEGKETKSKVDTVPNVLLSSNSNSTAANGLSLSRTPPVKPKEVHAPALADKRTATTSSSSIPQQQHRKHQAQPGSAKISLDPEDMNQKHHSSAKASLSMSSSRHGSAAINSSSGKGISKRAQMMLSAGRTAVSTSRLSQKDVGSTSLSVPPQRAKRKLNVGGSDEKEHGNEKRKEHDMASSVMR
mmetsp:Transcript_68535/g.101816  ORF Transcript_68535/g.101816 Transcript_68535/m.101816 type:complete len:848 (+) Transcript_68535:133-2676(+)